MRTNETTRSAILHPVPKHDSSAGPDSLNGQVMSDTQPWIAVEGQDSPRATVLPVPNDHAPAGSMASQDQTYTGTQAGGVLADNHPGGHGRLGPHDMHATGGQAPVPAIVPAATIRRAPVREQAPPAAKREPTPTQPALLADPLLALAADVLGDLEKVRIANENRLRQLTRSEEDSDGEDGRGWGLDLAHPAVSRLAALIHAMKCDSNVVIGLTGEKTPKKKGCCLEHDAERNLTKMLAVNPLGPWMAAQKGIGEKQGARLLASIGDPYIRPEITQEDGTVEPSRPRTVSELWAYCGLKPGQKRQRGERSNWSATAKMRAWNIAGSMLKAGNREIYDQRKAATESRVHAEGCVRCGPSGKPAAAGSPWSDAHRHADALRVVSKEVLKELWREARRIHQETSAGGHIVIDPQTLHAASGNSSVAEAAA